MTTKTLTDGNGDRTSINLWASDRITLGTRQGSRYAEVGPFDPADVIAAIREALRETSKTLTDGDGRTLHIYLCHPGLVSLDSGQSGKHALVGPFDPDNLIEAIREVAGETSCDAVSPGGNYRCTRERGHITEHVATMFDGEVCDTWPVEADDKPEPAPSKSPTAEDFTKAEFARHEDGRTAHRCGPDTWQTTLPMEPLTTCWLADADMAAEGGWSIVTPAEDSISRAELDARLARRDEAHKRQVTRMQRHIETLQGHLARRREQMDQMREQMEAMTPAPTTPREALALAMSLAYEVEGDTMPDQPGYMRVEGDGVIHAYPDGNPIGLPARDAGCRRLLLDTPAPVTPEWHSARIVRATLDDVTCEWAQETSTLWRSLDGHGYIATADALTDVTVVVPGEVEA